MEHVQQLQVVGGAAEDSTTRASAEHIGDERMKPRGAYCAPKLERLGSVANVALFSGGGTTFF